MCQSGFFDFEDRVRVVVDAGDPLTGLSVVDWEIFRSVLDDLQVGKDGDGVVAEDGVVKVSNAGRRPYDRVLMFKALVLGSLYNLSDYQLEFQIKDRISFLSFLGLGMNDSSPDAKTIWKFREDLKSSGLLERLFTRFDELLEVEGFKACKGQIVDASIIKARTQRNSRSENQLIKETGSDS